MTNSRNLLRGDLIKVRLKKMTDMAIALKSVDTAIFAANNDYIRIGGEAYRAVSLHDNAPLCRYTNSKEKNLEKVIEHFRNGVKDMALEVLKSKEERRLQCWLIKRALLANRDLTQALSLSEAPYDKLIFALDEVSIGDRNHTPIIRCDILAVGVKDRKTFPVLIELKSKRNMKELERQLCMFSDELQTHKKEFAALLAAICTEEITLENFGPIRKMLIWPANTSSRAKRNRYDLNKKKIDVIEYSIVDGEIGNVKFTASFSDVYNK